MPMPSPAELLASATEAARAGAVVLQAAFGGVTSAVTKSHSRDLVTAADTAAERAILAVLDGQYPQFGLLAEESGSSRRSDVATWIVDPLDGTSNFAHGYPIFSISIGLVDRTGSLVGVVLDPLRDELFAATRGGGATLNGRPVHVSAVQRLDEALFSTGYPYFPPERRRRAGEVFVDVMVHAAANRRGGSAAIDLAYVAAGRSEAHYELNLAPHDVAAGVLLVQEAGGRVEALDEAGRTCWPLGIVATNGSPLHEELIEIVAPRLGLASLPLSFDGALGAYAG